MSNLRVRVREGRTHLDVSWHPASLSYARWVAPDSEERERSELTGPPRCRGPVELHVHFRWRGRCRLNTRSSGRRELDHGVTYKQEKYGKSDEGGQTLHSVLDHRELKCRKLRKTLLLNLLRFVFCKGALTCKLLSYKKYVPLSSR